MTKDTPTPAEADAARRTIDALNAEVDALHSMETARLSAARHRALSPRAKRRLPIVGWQGAAIASVLTIAVIGGILLRPVAPTQAPVAEIEPTPADSLFNNLPLLASGEDVEFYQDLEFLIWLESNAENAT